MTGAHYVRGSTRRVICTVCGSPYWRNTGPRPRHLDSRRHQRAAVAAGLTPDFEQFIAAICEICGGSAADRSRHIHSRKHREAAERKGVNPRWTEFPTS